MSVLYGQNKKDEKLNVSTISLKKWRKKFFDNDINYIPEWFYLNLHLPWNRLYSTTFVQLEVILKLHDNESF